MISHWIAATSLILLVAAGMTIAWQFRKNAKLGDIFRDPAHRLTDRNPVPTAMHRVTMTDGRSSRDLSKALYDRRADVRVEDNAG